MPQRPDRKPTESTRKNRQASFPESSLFPAAGLQERAWPWSGKCWLLHPSPRPRTTALTLRSHLKDGKTEVQRDLVTCPGPTPSGRGQCPPRRTGDSSAPIAGGQGAAGVSWVAGKAGSREGAPPSEARRARSAWGQPAGVAAAQGWAPGSRFRLRRPKGGPHKPGPAGRAEGRAMPGLSVCKLVAALAAEASRPTLKHPHWAPAPCWTPGTHPPSGPPTTPRGGVRTPADRWGN